jgi:hypothetical protein
VQTLTLIDAFWPRGNGTGADSPVGRTVYTTYNMRTLEPITSQQLPGQIRPSQGPMLRRIG